MTSMLDPAKWELLHQEGAILIEQINRKIAPHMGIEQQNNNMNSTRNDVINIHTQEYDLPYLERSFQRLQNITNEYFELFNKMKNENITIKKQLLEHFAIKKNDLTNRGIYNLESSPMDIIIAYDGLLSIFDIELQHKLDIISLFQTIVQDLISKALLSTTTNNITHQQSINQNMNNTPLDWNNIYEQWPWLQEANDIIQQQLQSQHSNDIHSNQTTIDNINNTNINTTMNNINHINQTEQIDLQSKDKEIIYAAHRTDLYGIIALFYQRPGYDLPQYKRLTTTIKSAPISIKPIIDLVSPITTTSNQK